MIFIFASGYSLCRWCVLGARGMLSWSRAKGTAHHWWTGWSDFDTIFFRVFFFLFILAIAKRRRNTVAFMVYESIFNDIYDLRYARIVVDKQPISGKASGECEKKERVSQAPGTAVSGQLHCTHTHTILWLTFSTKFNTRPFVMNGADRGPDCVCYMCGKGLTMSRRSFGSEERPFGHIKSTQTHAHKTKYFNNKKIWGLNK